MAEAANKYNSKCYYIFIGNTYKEINYLPSVYTDLYNFIKIVSPYGLLESQILELGTKIMNNIEVNNSEKNSILNRLIMKDFQHIVSSNTLSKDTEQQYSIYFNESKDNLLARLIPRINYIKEKGYKNIIILISGHGFENKITEVVHGTTMTSKTFGGFFTNDMKECILPDIIEISKGLNQYYFVDTCRVESKLESEYNIKRYGLDYENEKVCIIHAAQEYVTASGNYKIGGFLLSSLYEILKEYNNGMKEGRSGIMYGIFANCGSIKMMKVIAKLIKDWKYKDKQIPKFYANNIIRHHYSDDIETIMKVTGQSNASVMATKRNPEHNVKYILIKDKERKDKELKEKELKEKVKEYIKRLMNIVETLLILKKEEKDAEINKLKEKIENMQTLKQLRPGINFTKIRTSEIIDILMDVIKTL